MLCQYCSKEFQPLNPKGKFCSAKCRTYAGRAKAKKIETQQDVVAESQQEPKSPSPDETLFNLMEEYERLYLSAKCPSYIPAKNWKKIREDRLAELKRQIAEYDNKL